MTEQERARITSNDYADLLITYNGDTSVFDKFQDATIHIINYYDAVLHVPVSQINDNIMAKWGYAVMPSVFGTISESSLEASGITRIRNIPSFNLRGKGVLIGFLDTGIDYTNPVFKNADNTSRILSIWDQTITSGNLPPGMEFGTEYTRDQINQALKSANPLEIVPSKDDIGHGTMVAGIAAGNEVPDQKFSGVAPDAELVVVKLKPAKPYLKEFFRIPQNVNCYQENDILFALNYLFNISFRENKPLVVCIAIGTAQYAHDGRGSTSSYLTLQAQISGIAIIIAGGNEGNARRHYYGVVDPNTHSNLVELNVGENEYGFSMEIWGDSPGVFSIDILTPSGEYVPRIEARLDESRNISFIFEQTSIVVDYQMVESQSGDQLIIVRFRNPAPGIWKFNVYGRGDLSKGFNIWLPMSGFISDNTFFVRSDPFITILALGNATDPITVTAYNTEDNSLYLNASRGYTRIGIVKPEIAAPGVNVTAPSLTQGFIEVTGTSPACAHMAGVAAMLFEWGIVRGNYPKMNTIDMKIFTIRGAKRDKNQVYPNREWGYGILDVFNIFNSLRRAE